MTAKIAQLFVNNEIAGSSLVLRPHDRIQAYFLIPSDQSLSEAFQTVRLSHDYQSSGCYSITKQFLNESGSFTFVSLRELRLDGCCLTDQDVFFLLLPLLNPLPSLHTFSIQDNQLTDIAARCIALWLMKGNAPSLRDLRIGQNYWQGDGLMKLLFAAKSHCAIDSLVRVSLGSDV